MFPFRVGLKPCLLALLMTACSGACAFAGESPSEEAIAKLGLKPVRTVLVLETERRRSMTRSRGQATGQGLEQRRHAAA